MISKRFISLLIVSCLTFGLLFKLVYWTQRPLIIWADQSVYMAMAQLLLMGKVPYIDFFDFNLPLIIYLNTIPMAMAQVFRQPPPLMLDFFILALTGLSIFLSNLVFRASGSRLDFCTRVPWLAALVIFTQMQMPDFGQREHFFVLLCAPYLLMRCIYPNCRTIPLARTMGVLAAVGANIKPHFLAIIVLFEVAAAISDPQGISLTNLKTRFERPEVKAFLIATLIYCLHFFLYPYKAWQIFMDEALPIYLNGSAFFGHSLISSVSGEEGHKYYFFALIAVTLLALPRPVNAQLTVPLITFSWAGVVIYLLTGGTWTYRLLPTEAGTLLLLAAELGIVFNLLRSKYLKSWPRLTQCAALSLAMATAIAIGQQLHVFAMEQGGAHSAPIGSGYQYSSPLLNFNSLYYSMLDNSVPDDAVVYIGGGVRPGYPATLQARRRPGCRYLHGMIIPMLRHCIAETGDIKYRELLHNVTTQYGEDILKNRPAVVYYEHEMFGKPEDEFFINHYLCEYEEIGTLQSLECHIYKLRGTLSNGSRPEDAKRDLVMKVLLKQISIEQAAEKLKMTPLELDRFLRNTSAAVDRSLFNTVGGGDEELYSRLQRAEQEKVVLQKTIDKLLRDQAALKEKLEKEKLDNQKLDHKEQAVKSSGGDK